jgi:FtsH-binding integral membrane protein
MTQFPSSQDQTYDGVAYRSKEATFITKVYGWMTVGLVITAVVALYTAGNEAMLQFIYGRPFVLIGLILAEFALVIGLGAAIGRMSAPVAAAMFLIYSAINGLTLSAVFIVYQLGSIGTVFFITAGTFGTMSIVGWVTRKDLTGIGNLCIMGLVGVILASVANWFLQSSALYWAITYIGIAVFVGLIAYDTQKLKILGAQLGYSNSALARKAAILGALSLYLDFVNLFLLLLRLFGRRR